MASARSIEVKVGLLILTAVVLLTGFILIMGGISFEPTFELIVGFDNPGGLQSGAPVKIAGVKVGKVTEIVFNPEPGKGDAATDALVYAHITIEQRHRRNVHTNAQFYVTTQGVLGEQFLAIDPGSPDLPLIDDKTVVRGLDPPRLDKLIAESYDLLHTTVSALRDHKPQIGELFDDLHKTVKGTGTFFENNQGKLDKITTNVELMTDEGVVTLKKAREKYVENPRIDRILWNIDSLVATSARDVPILLTKGERTLDGTEKIVTTFSNDAELNRIRAMLDDLATTTKTAKQIAGDAKVITSHIRRGRGSVGALVMDEQLFDDLQELARDLKHNPWKFFWKE
jgi:phospholipid/cholesterol/gamma-HCH transport system substrate-binding protein